MYILRSRSLARLQLQVIVKASCLMPILFMTLTAFAVICAAGTSENSHAPSWDYNGELELTIAHHRTRFLLTNATRIVNKLQKVGFRRDPGTALPNDQIPASSPKTAAVGQPLKVSRIATNPAVQCEVLVQQQGTIYPCNEGHYCTGLAFSFKNRNTLPIQAPWAFSLLNDAWVGVSNAFNVAPGIAIVRPGLVQGNVTLDWQTLAANGGNAVQIGFQLVTKSGDEKQLMPTGVGVGPQRCAVTTVFTAGPAISVSPPASPGPTPAVSPPRSPTAPPAVPTGPLTAPPTPLYNPGSLKAVRISGTQIIGVNGKPVELHGLNYFGFENGATAPDGLWAGNATITRDLVTIMRRFRLLGFNAVRLPFSMTSLFATAPRNFNSTCSVTSDAALQAATTPPGVSAPRVDVVLSYEPVVPPGTCNYDLSNTSVFNRFLWFINFLAHNGWYVVIDNHLNADNTAIDNPKLWLSSWGRIMSAIAADPISSKYVMYDILNEPGSKQLNWIGSGGRMGITEYYTQMMDQGFKINPKAVYLIEGTGQDNINANWGDGFCTDASCITEDGLNNPNSFFNSLMRKPYVNQVVISPHVYPPTVTYATAQYSGEGLNSRLTKAHGYLGQKPGYCIKPGTCKTFPIVVGEFGSRVEDPRDLEMLKSFASYTANTGAGADGGHQPITSWFWWSWNANSADTGGIVADDWLDILWNKIDFLETMKLQPYYAKYRSAPLAKQTPAKAAALPPRVTAPQVATKTAPVATSKAVSSAVSKAAPTAAPKAAPTAAPEGAHTAAANAAPIAAPIAAPTVASKAAVPVAAVPKSMSGGGMKSSRSIPPRLPSAKRRSNLTK